MINLRSFNSQTYRGQEAGDCFHGTLNMGIYSVAQELLEAVL